MAQKEIDVLAEVQDRRRILVWCDDREGAIKIVEAIEGVLFAFNSPSDLSVTIDPRYDANELADEITAALMAGLPDIPDAFRD